MTVFDLGKNEPDLYTDPPEQKFLDGLIAQIERDQTVSTLVHGNHCRTTIFRLDGRIVIGNTKTGSVLGYPIDVGAEGGSFIFNIEYKGFTGFDVDGYCYNEEASTNNELMFLRG